MKKTMTSVEPQPAVSPALVPGGWPYRLSWTLAAVATAATVPTIAVDGVLNGPAAMNGCARGTALVMAVVAVPGLLASTRATGRGSARALPIWLGCVAYLLYNATLLLIGTPFNELFLLYVATFTLALWTGITCLRSADLASYCSRLSAGVPRRPIAAFLVAVSVLNVLAWLRGIVPGLRHPESAAFLEGTGLTTSPTYVQDLAFWLPLLIAVGVWLWQDRPVGRLAAPAALTMWTVESIGIAVDQSFGHAADPSSPVASAAVVPAFAVLALICLAALVPFLTNLDRTDPDRGTVRSRWPSAL